MAGAKSDFEPFERRLTLAMLTPPVAWLTHLSLSYALVPSFCLSGDKTPLHLATISFLGIVALAGIYSRSATKKLGSGPTDGPDSTITRMRFMALAGVVFAITFAILILANEVPNLILRGCDG